MKITVTHCLLITAVLASEALAQRVVAPVSAPGSANASVALPAHKSSKAAISYRASRSSVPPIVVQFSSAESSRVQEMSEDLDVMTHILDQALRDDDDDSENSPPDKMGIKLYITGSSRSVRAMYLEDFGALFMVKVNFPLQGGPASKEEEAEKPVDSEWARARAEVLGEPGWPGMFSGTVVDFDPKRVEGLKSVLIRSLKNASNIRHLKPQEVLSVSVFGSVGRIDVQSGRSSDGPRASSTTRPKLSFRPNNNQVDVAQTLVLSASGGGQGTVLTLRVKKADIDAFAKGDMDVEAFTKTVTFNNYIGAGHDVTSINSWTNEGVRR